MSKIILVCFLLLEAGCSVVQTQVSPDGKGGYTICTDPHAIAGIWNACEHLK